MKGLNIMKNILNTKTNTAKELQAKELERKALYFINTYILPKANKNALKGHFAIKIKIPFTKRKYSNYLKELLTKKGFADYDIKVNKKTVYLQWID